MADGADKWLRVQHEEGKARRRAQREQLNRLVEARAQESRRKRS